MMCFGLKDRKRLKTNHCVIVLLDDTQLVHELHPTSTGQDLLDVVIKHLNLLETSYFGLKYYQDAAELSGQPTSIRNGKQQREQQQQQQQQAVWLDVDKSAIKQLRDVNPMTVHFGVKYYASDPCKLAEEITRYQFFLQCKQDILQARLPVSFELAIELFGLAIQSELGDYDPLRHQDNYASEFQFVAAQSHELEQRAALFHRQLTGQVPATAELNFLEKVKWLDLYGCQLHRIQYDDGDLGDQYALGLNPSGVLVLRNRLKVAQYFWARIVKTKCQGRCFLMDVIDAQLGDQQSAGQLTGGLLLTTANGGGGGGGGTLGRDGNKPAGANGRPPKRNRFGFRLADKDAARRLRWAIEEHKHFYYLIHSSSSPNQLSRAQRQQQQQAAAAAAAAAMAAMAAEQQQQMKFSQRFRNSIRSAIHLGAPTTASGSSSLHLHSQQQAQLAFAHQQQKLRSSAKSLNHQLQRPPPTVVRTPSRRYSNRSLPRPSNVAAASLQQHQHYRLAANGNGLPPVAGMSHTMVPDQRQQALLMMHQQHYGQAPFMMQQQPPASDQYYHPTTNYNHLKSKSHTLKPISSKEAKARGQANPYYQMMMMMAAQQQQHHNNEQKTTSGLPEVSILPPGQHIVKPSIYKATSVVDGIDQLANVQKQQQQQQYGPTMMQQFFNTRPQYAGGGHVSQSAQRGGAESPRSTKSAMVPSSALKLASRKLAKQQQQFLYGTRRSGADTRPLLAYAPDIEHAHHHSRTDLHYTNSGEYSAGASPRSARSARSLGPKYRRSKSTGENLHLAHLTNGANNKMLLAEALPPVPAPPHHLLPPPDYNSSTPISTLGKAGRPATVAVSAGKMAAEQRRRDIARVRQQPQHRQHSDDDDYYCSRSDCSSLEERLASQSLGGKARQARFINGHLVDTGAPNHHHQQSSSLSSSSMVKEQQEWQAIRQRHSEFSSGKGPLGQLEVPTGKPLGAADPNNNELQPTSKNITNKQATPILLTMTQTAGTKTSANSKAVQLLNMQRQQLNHQTSADGNQQAGSERPLNSGSDSTPSSSVASSPKADQTQTGSGGGGSKQRFRLHHNAADSTASNSTTTSGYYAGSNSTGPASVDSDNVSADTPTHSATNSKSPAHRAGWTPNASLYNNSQQQQQREGGTRAKIALGVHGPSVRGLGTTTCKAPPPVSQPPPPRRIQEPQQQQYYMGESSSSSSSSQQLQSSMNEHEPPPVGQHSLKSLSQHQQQQWNQLEQIQQNHAPSSLKYVSFDV